MIFLDGIHSDRLKWTSMDSTLFSSCLQKQKLMKETLLLCDTPEAKYKKLIEMGKFLDPMEIQEKTGANRVEGCQSILYLHTTLKEGKLYFNASSEALISSGLAALLIAVYSGESPETILKCPPTFIQEIGLDLALSPGRSNGLSSMYLRMQQESLKALSNLL